jgi:type I restriction enzyme S subunit
MNWNKVKFKKFITLQRGFDLPVSEMKDGEIPVLGSTGIIGYHNKAKVNSPGVVTGRSGTIGLVQYTDKPYWPHNTSLWIKDFKANNPKFIYYKLQTLKLNRFKGGASVPTLNRNNLDNLLVQIPDIPTQEKIASILSSYDDLIGTNRRRIQLLEEAARLLFREWFVYFRFPGHEKVKIVDGVPEGWKVAKVKELGKIVTGKTPSKKDIRNFNGNVPFIKTPDMHKSWIISKTEETLSETGASSQNNKHLPPWSVLVSCIGTVGVVAINLFRSQTNQQINSVIPKKEIYRYYSFFCLSRMRLLLEAIGGGSTMTNVNKNKFENLGVNIPPDTILESFDQLVDPLFKQVAFLLQQNQKLAQARDLLLPRLMSGEIEV